MSTIKLQINTKDHKYPIFIGSGLINKLSKLLKNSSIKFTKCLLVIDSAYSEYVIKNDYSDTISFAKQRKDIIVTHTFSKIFGLSAVRLGWAYCPDEVVEVLAENFNSKDESQLMGRTRTNRLTFFPRIGHENYSYIPGDILKVRINEIRPFSLTGIPIK